MTDRPQRQPKRLTYERERGCLITLSALTLLLSPIFLGVNTLLWMDIAVSRPAFSFWHVILAALTAADTLSLLVPLIAARRFHNLEASARKLEWLQWGIVSLWLSNILLVPLIWNGLHPGAYWG